MERLAPKPPALEVENLSFTYRRDRHVLYNISFSLEQGNSMTILGPNGAGKTTLLNCILRNADNYQGEIKLFGKRIQQYTNREFAATAAYVPQLTQLSFDYTVEEFVLMGTNPQHRLFDLPDERDYERTWQCLESLGVGHLKNRYMGEISGGERQLAYIARALAQQPRIIVMDEPTSALDYSNQFKVIQILKDLTRRGYSVVLTSHNPDYAFMLGGKVGMLFRDGSFEFGPVKAHMTDQRLSRMYGTPIKVYEMEALQTSICVRLNEEIKQEG